MNSNGMKTRAIKDYTYTDGDGQNYKFEIYYEANLYWAICDEIKIHNTEMHVLISSIPLEVNERKMFYNNSKFIREKRNEKKD